MEMHTVSSQSCDNKGIKKKKGSSWVEVMYVR
jgi:hypothetical protein